MPGTLDLDYRKHNRMKISVEISMYPLDADYEPPILDFLARLNAHNEVDVHTNSMSTQLFGEYQSVMEALSEAMELTFQQDRKVAMVFKCINVDLSAPYVAK